MAQMFSIKLCIRLVFAAAGGGLLGLNNNDILVADHLHKKDALLAVILETIILGVIVEYKTQHKTYQADEDLGTVGHQRDYNINVLVFLLKRASDRRMIHQTEAQQLHVHNRRDYCY